MEMSKIAIQLSKWIGKSDHLLSEHAIYRGRRAFDANILIADTKPLTLEELDKRIPHLKGIVRPGVGYDNIPLEECSRRGIVCAYTPNAPSQAVAEWTLGMILTAARKLSEASNSLKSAVLWPDVELALSQIYDRWPRLMGRSLSELSIGIVGLGRIYGCDPVGDSTFDEINRVDRVDMETLLSMSDVVTLHVPRQEDTIGMIGEAELTLMPKCGIILNCSRGGIVQEDCLLRHLEKNPEFTACLDVFNTEPYAGPLVHCPNAILTAHMGAMTTAARERMEREGIDAALSILRGETPRWEIPVDGGTNTGTSQL